MTPEQILVEWYAIQKVEQRGVRQATAQPGEETHEFDGSDAFAALAAMTPQDDDDWEPVDPATVSMPA